MKKVRKVYFFMVCSAFYFLAGCTDTGKFKAIEQINVPGTAKAEVMSAAEAVLGEMHFAIAFFISVTALSKSLLSFTRGIVT